MNTEDTTVNTAIPALKSQTVESDRAYAESANDCSLGVRSRIAAFEWRMEFMICNAIPVRDSGLKYFNAYLITSFQTFK